MGGGGPGGSLLRTVSRVVTGSGVTGSTTFQEPLSSSASSSSSSASGASNASPTATSRYTHKPNSPCSSHLSISSSGSPFASQNLPIAANTGVPTWGAFASPPSSCCDDFEWVSLDGSDDEFILGAVPSIEEVQSAVSSIQQAFDATYSELVRDKFSYNKDKDVADQISSLTGVVHPGSLVATELDWKEPSLHLCNSRMLHGHHGYERVYDAFHLLQTEPSVQKMVISLSSDKAVWDAVLRNEVVRELRESYYAGITENDNPESSDETCDDPSSATSFIKWIFDSTKAKFQEVFEQITKLVNELFKPPEDKKTTAGTPDPFEEKLRTSFLLSILVLLVVVVSRASRA